ncbi:MAG: penicillin-binding protein [Clostridiales bacterium]|nr:penicillin-binding protein [Clostridiales bacterium]
MKKAAKVSLIVIISIVLFIALSVGFFFLLIEPNVTIFGSTDLDLDKLTSYSRTVTVLDCDGKPIDGALFDNDKLYVKYDELNDYTVNAFIAIEDKRFYDHSGVDYKRMASAAVNNIKSGKFSQGASTITQQLIKNTHLSNEKTIKRKIEEIRLARKLERVYDKEQILESYLNILYFGSGIRGLGTASRVMFNKPVSRLTLAQSAALASIINNPTKYSPYNNIDNLTERKELVLRQMLDQGFITENDYKYALSEKLSFSSERPNQFTSALLRDACRELDCTEKQLFNNQFTIKTAYNPRAVSAVRAELSNEKYDDYNVRVIILDNKTGGVMCDETNVIGYVNPQRSPASTIKPFISYAPALENGLNPLSQIEDKPTVFGDYAPKNYKEIYRGYQSLNDCLAYSSNIAAVKLLNQNGMDKSKAIAQNFGLSFTANDDSLALALGGMDKGVTLMELANAYRTLANGGKYSKPHYLLDVSNNDGQIYESDIQYKNAVGDDTAYLITNMLTNCAQYGTAKKLKYSGVIAAKTGTNGDENGNYDCYCIAYTPSNTVAVWFGAKDNEHLIDNKITGAKCSEIIKMLCDTKIIKTTEQFEMPQSVAYYDIDYTALNDMHEVYLADPMLPRRYRYKAVLSKRHLPVKRSIDIIDYYDYYSWQDGEF